MKFGGTSVADSERIVNAVEIIEARKHLRPVVVVSALAGVTDLLERATAAACDSDLEGQEPVLADIERRHRWALDGCLENQRGRHDMSLEVAGLFEELRRLLRSIRILGEGSPRTYDAILSFGEMLSSRILCAAMESRNIRAEWMDPREVMITDRSFGSAIPDQEMTADACRKKIVPLVEDGVIPVVGGFVGTTPDGLTTTLGRGGSDTSAAVIGAALGAGEIQIWTDVAGLMTADPRMVDGARPLDGISFAEAAELAFYGASVIHPQAVAEAVRRNIPVRILGSLNKEAPGTVILEECGSGPSGVSSIASRGGVSAVRVTTCDMGPIQPFLGRILEIVEGSGVEPELVVVSKVAVTIVLPRGSDPVSLGSALASVIDVTYEIMNEMAVVSVVGSAMATDAGLRGEVLAVIGSLMPEVVVVGGSSISTTALVREDRLEEVVAGLHGKFFEEGQDQ